MRQLAAGAALIGLVACGPNKEGGTQVAAEIQAELTAVKEASLGSPAVRIADMTGPKREGMFAINYAMLGRLENPQLVVNPLSVVTPGITRELMQIAPQDPRIVPPRKQQPAGKAEGGVRASSSPKLGPKAQDAGSGWSSESDLPAAKKR